MDEKLRRWLESRCWAEPDGTWLVHPAVIRMSSPPSFILPDEDSKQLYIARAVPLGRLHMWSELATQNALYLFLFWTNLSRALDLGIDSDLEFAVPIALIVVVFVSLWLVIRGEKRLLAWLERTGRDGRVGKTQKPRWWSIPQTGLKRCRPGWMVVADALAMSAFAAGVAILSVTWGYKCRRARSAWWEAGEPWFAFPKECLGLHSAIALIMAAVVLVLMAGVVWDWWRWNTRRAPPPVSPA